MALLRLKNIAEIQIKRTSIPSSSIASSITSWETISDSKSELVVLIVMQSGWPGSSFLWSKDAILIALLALGQLPTNVLSVTQPVPTGSPTPPAQRAAPPVTVPAPSSPTASLAIQPVCLVKGRGTIAQVAKQQHLGLLSFTSTHPSVIIHAFLFALLFLQHSQI